MKITLESFLEPTSAKQWGYSLLLKETMGAFDRAQTHNWQESTNYKADNPLRYDDPQRNNKLLAISLNKVNTPDHSFLTGNQANHRKESI